jgi:hypothetical protein
LQDLIVALEQIGNLASRNEQLVRIILMQDPMIHTLIYALVLELPYPISNVNILPEVGLYNDAIETVIEIVYQGKPVGPNDKEHSHLPDYVVVDFPNLKLLTGIPPWDKLHKTVSSTC